VLALSLAFGACEADGPAQGPDDEPGGGGAGAGGSRTPRAGSTGTGGTAMAGGAGGTVGGGTGGMGVTVKPPPPPAACSNAKWAPPERPLTRLTGTQYKNTIADLLKMTGVPEVAKEIETALNGIQIDRWDRLEGLKLPFNESNVNGFVAVAKGIADGIAASPARLGAAAGKCAEGATLDAKCLDDFIQSFGRRALRRPLAKADVDFYKGLVDPKAPPADAFRSVVFVMLTSSRFLNHLEIDGTVGADGVLPLTTFELANRLSYTFWQSMPDEALFQAAADGSLATDEGYKRQVDRLFAHDRTKETLATFWADWLSLDKLMGYEVRDPVFAEIIKDSPVNATNAAGFLQAVLGEVRELTEFFTYTKKGTMADLFLTDLSVTKSKELAAIYGTQPWNGMGEPPRVGGNRVGLLTRTALVGGVDEVTNPFHRGAIVRRRLLCDPLHQPEEGDLPPGSLVPPPPDAAKTTRQRFASKLENEGKPIPQCAGCHALFSDIGYILEAYDTLGRYRTMEKVAVLDRDGKPVLVGGKPQIKELPIDVKGVPRVTFDDDAEVNGPLELVKKMVDSKKLDRCFAQTFFEFVTQRLVEEADECTVQDAAGELGKNGGSMADVYKRIVLQAGFRARKVGAQ
jgi:hypothetical protein